MNWHFLVSQSPFFSGGTSSLPFFQNLSWRFGTVGGDGWAPEVSLLLGVSRNISLLAGDERFSLSDLLFFFLGSRFIEPSTKNLSGWLLFVEEPPWGLSGGDFVSWEKSTARRFLICFREKAKRGIITVLWQKILCKIDLAYTQGPVILRRDLTKIENIHNSVTGFGNI